MTTQSADTSTPMTAEDHMQRGWIQHAKDKLHASAEESFRQAIDLNPRLIDAYYGLGLSLKAMSRPQEAIEVFQKVVELIDSGVVDDPTRSAMLRRLSIGHINQMRGGNWDLEKELWQRKT